MMSGHPTIKHRHTMNRGARPKLPLHHLCAGEKYFAPTCAIYVHSPNHQKWPHHKSWRIPDVTTHRMCRGEIFFARPCAFDAPSTTRCDRAPAMRRRTMDVRAKNISPLRVPTMSILPPIKHERTTNRGARPIRPYTTVVRAKNISPLRVPLMSDRPPFARACALGAAPPRRAH